MVDAAMSFRGHRADAVSTPGRERAGAAVDISVSAASGDALAAYADLCGGGCVSSPQSTGWIREWLTHARPDGLVAILRSGGKPVYGLALEIVRSGPFRVARFMSGRHANGNFPPADPAFAAAAGPPDMQAIAAAIRAARPDIDLLALERLLPDLDGTPNPLVMLSHYASPNVALAVDLDGGFEAVLARAGGKRKSKKHRSQTRKFEAAGGFRRIEAKTPEETARLLDAFFAMKELRFRKVGIANVFGDPEIRAFLNGLFSGALGQNPPAFVLHAIEVNGILRAVTGSSRSARRLTCEFGAIAEDDLAHTSPGEFLFFDSIGEACEQGLAVYDFGIGDEPYKRTWCDIETRHVEVVVPLTAKGQILALQLRLDARLRAFVKSSPLIWNITKLVRKRAAGLPQPADD